MITLVTHQRNVPERVRQYWSEAFLWMFCNLGKNTISPVKVDLVCWRILLHWMCGMQSDKTEFMRCMKYLWGFNYFQCMLSHLKHSLYIKLYGNTSGVRWCPIRKLNSCWIPDFHSFKIRNIRPVSEENVLKPYTANATNEFPFQWVGE